jgi:hypothetical protein
MAPSALARESAIAEFRQEPAPHQPLFFKTCECAAHVCWSVSRPDRSPRPEPMIASGFHLRFYRRASWTPNRLAAFGALRGLPYYCSTEGEHSHRE